MKTNKFKTLSAVASVTALLALAGTTLSAAPCFVPGDHATIQAAVIDVTCDSIYVAPGAYAENILVNRSVAINGAQAGNNDFATRSANPASESIVSGVTLSGSFAVFTIGATDVTIDGFTIKNTVASDAAMGITVNGAGNNSDILNNIFDGISTPDTGSQGTAQAVYLNAGPDGVIIADNEMKNIESDRSAKGVLIGDNGGTNPSQNVRIRGNFIHDVTSGTRGAYGVSVANVFNVLDLRVTMNTISNLTGGGWVHGLGLEGDTPGVRVFDNDFSNLTDLTPSTPSDSICVFFESNPSFSTADVHTNNFNVTAPSYGIAVHPAIVGAGSLDGTCNWWNSPNGPTAGAQVSPRVTFAPWLTAPGPDGSCVGGTVPTNKDQCKNGGWMTLTRANGSAFRNQGDCIQYVNTGM